jgi:hypothetical protein
LPSSASYGWTTIAPAADREQNLKTRINSLETDLKHTNEHIATLTAMVCSMP